MRSKEEDWGYISTLYSIQSAILTRWDMNIVALWQGGQYLEQARLHWSAHGTNQCSRKQIPYLTLKCECKAGTGKAAVEPAECEHNRRHFSLSPCPVCCTRGAMLVAVLVILASLNPALSYTVVSPDTSQFPLVMPGARPSQPDSYLCTTLRLDPNTTHWITGFQPQAEMGTAHHMLLFGCKQPGQLESLFSCGEMGRVEEGTKLAAPCQQGQQIIYAWARNAPELQLPPGVGATQRCSAEISAAGWFPSWWAGGAGDPVPGAAGPLRLHRQHQHHHR